MSSNSVQERLARYLEADNHALGVAVTSIFPDLPKWVPTPSRERVRRIVKKLLIDGFSADDINRLVREAEKDELVIPGIVTDSVAFTQAVYELAHLRYAGRLGKLEGLRVLAGNQAVHGQRFSDGRKRGTVGSLRKLINEMLAERPSARNSDLWRQIEIASPNGFQTCYTAQLGKYIEGPEGATGYKRFCNICSEERRALI
jgi:hypothetical protein